MRNPVNVRNLMMPLALSALLVGGLIFTGCEEDTVEPDDQSGTFYADSQAVGDGTAKLYVTLNEGGEPIEIGIRLSEDALTGLPDTGQNFWFYTPSEGNATVITHTSLNWNPHGHPPATIFDTAHFDAHFYMMPEADRLAIDPGDTTKVKNLPDSNYVPADYFTPPPIMAESEMGVHWLDSTSGLAPGTFDKIFIWGTWDGMLTFAEPMFTMDWLMTKPDFSANIKQPAKYQQSGFWPVTYSITYEAATSEYVISMELEEKAAS